MKSEHSIEICRQQQSIPGRTPFPGGIQLKLRLAIVSLIRRYRKYLSIGTGAPVFIMYFGTSTERYGLGGHGRRLVAPRVPIHQSELYNPCSCLFVV